MQKLPIVVGSFCFKTNTMKKIVLAVFVPTLLMACIKDRTCTCTKINSKTQDTLVSTTKIKGSTRSQAESNCLNTSETNSAGATITAECKLN